MDHKKLANITPNLRHPQKGNILLGLIVSVAAIAVLGTVGYSYDYVGLKSSATTSRTLTTDNYAMQAAHILVAESSDSDADGVEEAPVVKTGAGPTGGGLVPDASGAPKTDGWGSSLGYCSWDHGSINISTGRITGNNPGALSDIVFSVISAGEDKTFDTTCSQILSGSGAQDDDRVQMVSLNQIRSGISGTVHWRQPATDLTALQALDTTNLTDGEVRLTKDTNNIYRWNSTTTTWQEASPAASLGSGTASYLSKWDTNTTLTDSVLYEDVDGNIGMGTTTPKASLEIASPALQSPSIILSDGDVALPDYSGSASLGAVSLSNTTGRFTANRGSLDDTDKGGLTVQGFTGAGVNDWNPLYLVGTHGGNSPTSAAVVIAGQKKNSIAANREGLSGPEPVLDIKTVYTDGNSIGGLLVRVQADGNVGFGIPAPQHSLHISKLGQATLYLEADTDNTTETDTAFIKLSQDGAIVGALIGTTPANDKAPDDTAYTGILNNSFLIGTTTASRVALGTDNKVALTVGTDQSIGIGTNDPNELLSVAGRMSLLETTTPLAGTLGYGKFYVKSLDSLPYFMDDSGIEHLLIAAATAVDGSGTANYLSKYTDSNTLGNSVLYEDTTGNIGIGTTTPGDDLDLYRASGGFPSLRLSSGDVTLPDYSVSGSVGDISLSNTYGQLTNNKGGGGTNIEGGLMVRGFTSAGVNDWNPLVLVGTHGGISPSVAAVMIAGQRHDGTANRTLLSGTTPVLDVKATYAPGTSDGGLLMRVRADGLVGFLTPTPNEVITANGRLSLAETTAPTATAGYGKFYVKATDSLPYFLDDSGIEHALTVSAFIDGSGTANYLPKFSDSNTLTNSVISEDASGNVGFSQLTPTHSVHVSKLGNANLYLEADTDNVGGGTAYIKLTKNNGASGSIMGTISGDNLSPDGSTYTGTVNGGFLIGTTNDFSGLHLGVNNGVAFTITRLKNIGIGTTNANELLTLQGVMSMKTTASPTVTGGYGKHYVKFDGFPYYMDPTGVEYPMARITGGATANYFPMFDATGGGLVDSELHRRADGNIILQRNGAALFESFAHSDTGRSGYGTVRTRGTQALPTAVANGDILGEFYSFGYDGANWIQATSIQSEVDGIVASTRQLPGRIVFKTRPSTNTNLLERMRINKDGYVSIGTTAITRKLFVSGDAGGTTAWSNDSDERFKKDITTITNAMEIIKKMRGVRYHWRKEDYPDRNYTEAPQVGFIAQELMEILPEVVSQDKTGYYGVAYAAVTPVIVQAMQEQQKEIDRLKTGLTFHDNPLSSNPDDKIAHADLEGPEKAVFYRGESALAGQPCVSVMLPEYFESMTDPVDRTVLITPKFKVEGENISTLAASEVVGGQFSVCRVGEKNITQAFYWEVKAKVGSVEPMSVEVNLNDFY